MLDTQGQVTTGRLTTLLNDIGLDISKRQVVRLVTGQLEGFAAEDAAVLHAGLVSSSYVTVDDTGARHSHNSGYATHIGARRPPPICKQANMLNVPEGHDVPACRRLLKSFIARAWPLN
jgi:hypothetical protein